jgi:hypothetical protein
VAGSQDHFERHELLQATVRGVVSVAGLAGITYLASIGKVTSDTVTAVYSMVLSLYGAAALRSSARRNGTDG